MDSNITPHEPNDGEDLPQQYRPDVSGGLHGEFGVNDQAIPYLKILQSVGDAAVKYPNKQGELILGETLLPRPITITFFEAQKAYQQNLIFDKAVQPLVVGTAKEVEELGGNLKSFVKPGQDPKNFIPIARALVVVELPKSKKIGPVEGAFEYQGQLLVAAMFALRNTGYRAVIPKLMSAIGELQRTDKSKELAHVKFKFDTQQTKFSSNFTYVPVLTRLSELNSDVFVQYLHQEVFGK